jgi:hypothetical protein
MSVLGKFSVIMADPPWDIHMELPYGTMADEEMRRLDIPSLQDEGYIFLWVIFLMEKRRIVFSFVCFRSLVVQWNLVTKKKFFFSILNRFCFLFKDVNVFVYGVINDVLK